MLPCDFISFYNGAMIYAQNVLIENNSLPYQQAALILQKINNDFPDVVIDVNLEPWTFSSFNNELCHMDSGQRELCSINNLPKCDVQRIRLKSKKVKISLEKYMTNDSIFYDTIVGDSIIVHKKANKGYATRKAPKYFMIPLTQMIAFGDDTNDIDMIKLVGVGVAMGNSTPQLKEVADYITDTNDNNGIASWINKYLKYNFRGKYE
jgi:cof family protein